MTAAWSRRRRGARSAGGRGPSEPRDPSPNLLRKHPELIELAIESVVQSQQLTQSEADELRSFVRQRLGDNDFAAAVGYDDDAPVIMQVLVIVDRLTVEHRDELWKR